MKVVISVEVFDENGTRRSLQMDERDSLEKQEAYDWRDHMVEGIFLAAKAFPAGQPKK